MNETMKMAAELAKISIQLNMDEVQIEEVVKIHKGDVKAALRTLYAAKKCLIA